YCQLRCYRFEPLRNSGMVRANGIATRPAGNVIHQYVSPYRPYQSHEGRVENQTLIAGRPRQKWRQLRFGHDYNGSGCRQ
ncbi:hypothetical protein Cfor_07912, partial [Coptotermes formosanus]